MRSFSSLKYLSKIGLHIVNDSNLFNTFVPQRLSLRDPIPSFTFLCLKPHSFATTYVFSQSTSLTHSTLCLANPPSSFPILSFAVAIFPFFRSTFVNLTLLSCSFFFLVFTASTFLQHIPPSHICMEFCTQHLSTFHQVTKWLLDLVFSSFTFFPGLNAVRNRCFEASRLNCS